jgi:hypothetical protein
MVYHHFAFENADQLRIMERSHFQTYLSYQVGWLVQKFFKHLNIPLKPLYHIIYPVLTCIDDNMVVGYISGLGHLFGFCMLKNILKTGRFR